MKLSSEAFKQNGKIPSKFTCQGLDINPPLEISDVPENTQSLTLIMDDPDVPERIRKDRMWVHWVTFNIDPQTRTIKEGISTLGTIGQNTGGMSRYMGPCPPDKEHRYFFKLYALDCMLPLKEGATKEEVLKAMEGHILAQSELIGRFEKS
jgi:Raf kinase inhibitor-like YbhB/YbcL family protein